MAKTKTKTSQKHPKEEKLKTPKPQNHCEGKEVQKPHSWAVVRSLFTCKHLQAQIEQQQQKKQEEQQVQAEQPKVQSEKQNVQSKNSKLEPPHHHHLQQPIEESSSKKCKKLKCSGSICSNTKVMHRPELSSSSSPEEHKRKSPFSSCKNLNGSTRSMKLTLNDLNNNNSSSSLSAPTSSPSIVGSFRAMPFRKLSGCYECRMVVDPVLGMTRDPSLRTTISSCPVCGEIFMKPENLELHQSVRHAVSELGPEDTSRNIVEIIFQSSWLKKDTPICKIDRILKVHNTPRTISRFEEYREATKAKANKQSKKHPRCIADGNELLRFHCTTFACSLGLNASSNLCNSIPNCHVCGIIKNGFKAAEDVGGGGAGKGILTTATSGRAHDSARVVSSGDDNKRAMLVCRVIAGRVKKNMEGGLEEYDSVAGAAGVYSNLDELYVFNHRAILPCFVVIYREF
nr:Zinc finger, C2H [Ipomoea batatas]